MDQCYATYMQNTPARSNGKICYLEIPTQDIEQSATFYHRIFDWHIQKRGNGLTTFDDSVGQVSGRWVLNRPATSTIGLLVYIMVDDVTQTLEKIKAAGGNVVQEIGADAPEITARFSDPTGNILGLYQEPKQQTI